MHTLGSIRSLSGLGASAEPSTAKMEVPSKGCCSAVAARRRRPGVRQNWLSEQHFSEEENSGDEQPSEKH